MSDPFNSQEWRQEICAMLKQDAHNATLESLQDTARALQYLAQHVQDAYVYAGKDNISLKPQATLFDAQTGIVRTIMKPNMLLTYLAPDATKTAALYIDARFKKDKATCLELFIFRYKPDKARWMWPFIGLSYGPSNIHLHTISVYETCQLEKLPQAVQSAILQEHHVSALLAIAYLDWVCTTKPSPLLRGSAKTPNIAPLTPSSLAKASRTRHVHKGSSKGARRS
ncbi:MAG: hypothetical protein IJU79_00230 [Desulfovibrionaceae bacterium]|nr:hypothetical protein [Desulfovibrionaceae bacterium]